MSEFIRQDVIFINAKGIDLDCNEVNSLKTFVPLDEEPIEFIKKQLGEKAVAVKESIPLKEFNELWNINEDYVSLVAENFIVITCGGKNDEQLVNLAAKRSIEELFKEESIDSLEAYDCKTWKELFDKIKQYTNLPVSKNGMFLVFNEEYEEGNGFVNVSDILDEIYFDYIGIIRNIFK